MASSSSPSSSASSSSFFIFFLCFSMHACISSDARNIRVTNNNTGSIKDCKRGASTFVGQHDRDTPCRVIADALLGPEAKQEEHATTKSGAIGIGREVIESSSRMNFMEATGTDRVSGGSSAAAAGGRQELAVSENNINSHEDIIDMDYHTPRRNSPIHNR